MLLKTYIKHYINLNSENGLFSILRYFYKIIIYAPIDKS